MFVWYTKKFDGKYMINLSSDRPDPKPLGGTETAIRSGGQGGG